MWLCWSQDLVIPTVGQRPNAATSNGALWGWTVSSTTARARNNGALWGWEDDLYGQLDDGKGKKKEASPVKATLLVAAIGANSVTGLALDATDSFVLDSAGDVYAIGENTGGSLGD